MDRDYISDSSPRVDPPPTPDTELSSSLDELFTDLFETLVSDALAALVSTEIEGQRELVDSENYCSAVLRQAAFVESILQMGMIEEIESYRGEELSNQEREAVENMGNSPTVYMASAFGLLSDSEYEAYTKLMQNRNQIAHHWWMSFSEEEIEHFEHVSRLVLETLENELDEHNK